MLHLQSQLVHEGLSQLYLPSRRSHRFGTFPRHPGPLHMAMSSSSISGLSKSFSCTRVRYERHRCRARGQPPLQTPSSRDLAMNSVLNFLAETKSSPLKISFDQLNASQDCSTAVYCRAQAGARSRLLLLAAPTMLLSVERITRSGYTITSSNIQNTAVKSVKS